MGNNSYQSDKSKERLWPLALAGIIGQFALLSIGAYYQNQMLRDNSDPYNKTMSVHSGGAYVQKNIIDLDKDGAPDITRTTTAVSGTAFNMDRKCTLEEVEWFIRRNEEASKRK